MGGAPAFRQSPRTVELRAREPLRRALVSRAPLRTRRHPRLASRLPAIVTTAVSRGGFSPQRTQRMEKKKGSDERSGNPFLSELRVLCALCGSISSSAQVELQLFELSNAVADRGGFFKFELFRPVEHLLLERSDEPWDLVWGNRALALLGQLSLVGIPAVILRSAFKLGDGLLDGLGRDAMPAVVLLLHGTPLARDVDGLLHGIGLPIRVHDDLSAHVAGGAADGLNQRALGAQEAFLVGVENGDQGHLRQIQSLAQKVDADQHIELAQAQVAQDLDAFEGVDVRVQVADAHAKLAVVFG